jgi:Na+-transporting NADH:ubiquinone oxidoreductase subunit NqrF
MNTKRYTFSLVVVGGGGGGVRRVFFVFFVLKKERFFEAYAYEKGARSTKEALHEYDEYERSTHKANV